MSEPKKYYYKYGVPRTWENLLPLYKSLMQKEITVRELQWRFAENPLNDHSPLNITAFTGAGNDAVAHTAFIPGVLTDNRRNIRAALSAGSMVGKEHGGLFPSLLHRLEEEAVNRGTELLYAFPNKNSYPFFVKLFGYTFHHFALMSLDVKNFFPPHSRFKVDDLAGRYYNPLDESYLDWRIFKSPLHDYKVLQSESADVIYKFYGEDEIDILAFKFKDNSFDISVLKKLWESSGRIRVINLYSTAETFTAYLLTCGFAERSSPNRLVYKALTPKISPIRLFLQMIDSDVF